MKKNCATTRPFGIKAKAKILGDFVSVAATVVTGGIVVFVCYGIISCPIVWGTKNKIHSTTPPAQKNVPVLAVSQKAAVVVVSEPAPKKAKDADRAHLPPPVKKEITAKPAQFIDGAKVLKHYAQEAEDAFITVNNNGVLEDAKIAAEIADMNGEIGPEDLVTLSYFESSGGENEDNKKLSAKGVVQYQPPTFLEEIGQRGRRIADALKNHNPNDVSACAVRARKAGARLGFLMKYVSYNGNTILDDERFKKDFGKTASLKTSLFNLCKKEDARSIPLLLTALIFKERLPETKEHIANNASPFVQDLVKKHGVLFVLGLQHKLGKSGGDNITGNHRPESKTTDIVKKGLANTYKDDPERDKKLKLRADLITRSNKCKKILGEELEYTACRFATVRKVLRQKMLDQYNRG